MPIIKDCELWFAKLDPRRPNAKFNKENPTWEVQIRTTDKDVKKIWEELKLPVKAVLPDEGVPFWRVNLRKKTIKENKELSSAVKVVNGSLEDIDPNSIGNGSVGNVRIFQYEFPQKSGGNGLASVLMGIQVTKHIVYTPKPRNDDFEVADSETVDSSDESAY
jgi:hypothetical protein